MKKLLFTGFAVLTIYSCHSSVNNLKGTADSSSRNGSDSTPADVTKSTNSASSGSSSIRGSNDTTHVKQPVLKQAKDSLRYK